MNLDAYFRHLNSREAAKRLAFEESDNSHVSRGFIVAGICALIGLYAFVQYLEVAV